MKITLYKCDRCDHKFEPQGMITSPFRLAFDMEFTEGGYNAFKREEFDLCFKCRDAAEKFITKKLK